MSCLMTRGPRWPYQGLEPPATTRRGAVGAITSIDADVGARWDAMCSEDLYPGAAWTKKTLDACFKGVPDHEEP